MSGPPEAAGAPRCAGRREIDHTADLGFEVWASDLGDLYAQAALALAGLCYDRDAVRPAERRRLRVRGDSPEEAMVRWLQELYLLVEQEGWLTGVVEDVGCSGPIVEGTLLGEPLDRGRHTLHTEIKAVTYHELAIRRDDRALWRTSVIVDV